MKEQIEALRQYLTENGGEVLYSDFVQQIQGGNRVGVVAAARSEFNFSLVNRDGKQVHIVSLKAD